MPGVFAAVSFALIGAFAGGLIVLMLWSDANETHLWEVNRLLGELSRIGSEHDRAHAFLSRHGLMGAFDQWNKKQGPL